MPNVLTTASEILCDGSGTLPLTKEEKDAKPPPPPKPIHGGKVPVASATKLQVNGAQVLVPLSVMGKPVAGCKTPVTPAGNKPCTSVLAASGESKKLQAGGVPVLLDTLRGNTDGNPLGPLSVKANQNKLTAP